MEAAIRRKVKRGPTDFIVPKRTRRVYASRKRYTRDRLAIGYGRPTSLRYTRYVDRRPVNG